LERTFRIEWRWLVGLLLLAVLFVPPRRYAFPVSLPFELDPYRLLVLGLVFVFFLSALSDERFRFRASGLEAPLLLFAAGVAGSLAANPERFSAYQSEVIKTLSVLVGLFVVFYLVVNLIRTRDACEAVLTMLILGGAVLAVLAVVEHRTGWSPFVGLDRYLPFIQSTGSADLLLIRDGAARTFGSAEHPIALGALFAMLCPVAAALAVQRRKPIWVACLTLLVLGSFASVSRTAVLMLLSWGLLLLLLRWIEMKRFIPLALASVALINFAMPGTLGSLKATFLNPAGAIEEQKGNPDDPASAGRVADLGPSIQEFLEKPVLGYGVGTRVVTGDRANARLLDNQWLGTLLDAGLIGVIGLAWLLGRFVVRLSVASFRAGADGVLLAGLAAAAFSYIVGMFTYDALAFTQVTVVLFVLLAVGSSLVLAREPIMHVFEKPVPSTTPRLDLGTGTTWSTERG
jgi:polysaccharide biosynthesis protein PslJ